MNFSLKLALIYRSEIDWRWSQTCRLYYDLLRDHVGDNLRYSYQRRHYHRILRWFQQYAIAIDTSTLGKDPIKYAMSLAKHLNRGITISGNPCIRDLQLSSQRARLRYRSDDPRMWTARLQRRDVILIDLHWGVPDSLMLQRIQEAILAKCHLIMLISSSDFNVDFLKTFLEELRKNHSCVPPNFNDMIFEMQPIKSH